MQSIDYNKLQSQTFNYLRFPLIVLILTIHTIDLPHEANSVFSVNIGVIIRYVFATFGVPIFFIISGYYFFYSKNDTDTFNKESYISKLKKRVRTILVPYLLWNIFAILIFQCVQMSKGNTYIHNGFDLLKMFTYWLGAGNPYTPANYPLWYMRDLMFLFVLSPLIYIMLKYLKVWPLLILGGLYFFNIGIGDPFLFSEMVFFFPLGAYFAIHKKNIIELCNKYAKLSYILFIALIVFNLIFKISVIGKITTFVGVVALCNLVSYYLAKGKIKENKFYSDASFFLYAFHGVPIMILSNRLSDMLPKTDWAYTLNFFASTIIITLLGLGLYYVMKKIMPKFTAIITGGR